MARRVSTSPQEVSVLVADGNRLSAQLIGGALRQCRHRFRVVATVVSVEDALRHLQKERPRVLLAGLDLQDGARSGLLLPQQVRQHSLHTRVILLLDSLERDAVLEAFRAGAKGVFCRDAPTTTLCKCVYSVHRGQVWASSSELEWLLAELSNHAPIQLHDAEGRSLLTPREASIVHLVAGGLTNREIAKDLGISEHTVKNYLFRVFDKLGVSNRSELIVYALNQRAPI
jgi:DNA-binding NarL/FixJ family response regulator